jgi:arylformamidase
MKVTIQHRNRTLTADLAAGIDLSIPFEHNGKLNAYHAAPVHIEPFKMGDWVGEVAQGGSVNYRNISFNPHGNGTHTECVGHIDNTIHSVNEHFTQFHCVAQLVTVNPTELDNGDLVVTTDLLPELEGVDAVIIRTLPNADDKRQRNYSGSNPPYLHPDAVLKLVDAGCKHLILDLPSVDREEDEGKLLGHKAFWKYPAATRMYCTITELAFIPTTVEDGLYLLNLQVAPFVNDAAPSRPVIFPLG